MTNKEFTNEELTKIYKEMFKRSGTKYKVMVPNEVINYIKSKDETNSWKGKCLLIYMGIYLAFKESYYTYKERSINLLNIMELMGVSTNNRSLRKEFSSKSFLEKNGIITHINDLPLGYRLKRGEGRKVHTVYRMASELKKEEKQVEIKDFGNRQMRAIEPTIQIKGKSRVRGQGVEIITPPLDEKWQDCISFTYDTIHKIVSNRLSENELWSLAIIKQMTWNKNWGGKHQPMFRTSKARIAKQLGISASAFKKIHSKLLGEFDKNEYSMSQKAKVDENGNFFSEAFLIIKADI